MFFLIAGSSARTSCASIQRLRNSSAVVLMQAASRLLRREETDLKPQSWVSLDIPKHLWASGFDAKFSPVPQQPEQGEWLTWTPKAEAIFAKHYRDVHFPPEGCEARAARKGFVSARTDMEWGVTSVIRDVEDQLLYGLLQGKFVAFSNSVVDDKNVKDAMKQYHQQCPGKGIWMEDCYFEPLTGCTADFLARRLPLPSEQLDRRTFKITSEPAWFLERSQHIWDEMVAAGAVKWHKTGREERQLDTTPAPSSFASLLELAESEFNPGPMQFEAAQRLGMFRALLLKVAFRPNRALREAIKGVERRTQLPEVASNGPVTLIHIRRTDKYRDFVGGKQSAEEREAFDDGSLSDSLGTFAGALLPWLEGTKGPITSMFIMSDDWHVFSPEALRVLTRRLKATPEYIMFDPESSKLEPKDAETLHMGNEAWGHKAELGMYILASTFAMGKWAADVVGCGSSGVTQLAAQLIGGRLGVDPNSLGMWEDDKLNVDVARAEVQPASLLAVRTETREPRSLWGRAFEAFFALVGVGS